MGLMELPRAEPGQLIVTPHPMLLEGQRTVVWEARAGESLYALLMRNVPELDAQPWWWNATCGITSTRRPGR